MYMFVEKSYLSEGRGRDFSFTVGSVAPSPVRPGRLRCQQNDIITGPVGVKIEKFGAYSPLNPRNKDRMLTTIKQYPIRSQNLHKL